MADATDEPTTLQLDDARKVFVSRVPRTFDSEALRACLERALGDGGSAKGGTDIIEKAEVIWDDVRILDNGEAVSAAGTHLGHNLPDAAGNRYCINLVSVAGAPATA